MSTYQSVGSEGDIALDRSTYIRAIAIATAFMIAVLGAGAQLTWTWAMSWPLLLGSFFGALACIFLYKGSDNPIVSALGVSGMSFLLGMQVGPLLGMYAALYKGIVMQALLITGGVMGSMSAAGILMPVFFEGFGPFLMAGLWTLIWVQFGQIILGLCGFTAALNVPIITWAGILLFALFVAWDWTVALRLPHTLDNAIDASGNFVLDFVNLLIRILRVLADAKK
ncbi:MAG: US12 family protein [Candidatus Vogelbacteria bacterium]|nr:US12 family protein [Candidatus Vogelbacteria bacterium]